MESTAITLGETLGLGLSRAQSAVCAKPTVRDEPWGWGSCSVRLAGGKQRWFSPSCECQLLVHPTELSSCEVSGSLTDWRPAMDVPMADSTNDLYQLQVSPLASSSEGGYFFFSYPSLSLVCWRQGSRMKECLGQQEKQELFCRKSDRFGNLELPNQPGRRREELEHGTCPWVKGSEMPPAPIEMVEVAMLPTGEINN